MAGSVALLVVAGLFIRSVQQMEAIDLGFDTRHVLLISTDPAAVGYDEARTRAYYAGVDARLERLPGVASVATAAFVPFGTGNQTTYVADDSGLPPSSTTGIQSEINFVSSDYFDTIGLSLVGGRTFTASEMSAANQVAIVNEAMARRLWPAKDPIGKRFRSAIHPAMMFTVIGVARDGRYRLSEIGGPVVPRFFLTFAETHADAARTLHIRVRGGPPDSFAAVVQTTMRLVDASVPVFDVYTLDRQVADSSNGFGGAKGAAMVTSILGLLALMLSLVGTYGVLSFSLAERTRDISIRLALGLDPRRVFRTLLQEMWTIAALAIGVGLAVGMLAGRVMAGFLYGVAPHDPRIILMVVLVVLVMATVVGWLPARRASRVDPAETLRSE
jgi:predicted permease